MQGARFGKQSGSSKNDPKSIGICPGTLISHYGIIKAPKVRTNIIKKQRKNNNSRNFFAIFWPPRPPDPKYRSFSDFLDFLQGTDPQTFCRAGRPPWGFRKPKLVSRKPNFGSRKLILGFRKPNSSTKMSVLVRAFRSKDLLCSDH